MISTLLIVMAGLLYQTSCTHQKTAEFPREAYIKEYTRTGGVLSREKFVDPPIQTGSHR